MTDECTSFFPAAPTKKELPMPFITAADDVELYYEVEGVGFPLVFTHGNMGFGQQFFLQARIFRQTYQCIFHDLRGCGLSGKPQAEIYDTTVHASDLHAILKHLGVHKAVHVGHSFGGPISLQYYLDYPDEVAGLVCIGSYSAGTQLAITEEQVLQLYDSIQGRQTVFEKFVAHEQFTKYNPYGADMIALLEREACKPPIYAKQSDLSRVLPAGFHRAVIGNAGARFNSLWGCGSTCSA
jgi:pimeloyl-ACP methyl ester carboxylesterase